MNKTTHSSLQVGEAALTELQSGPLQSYNLAFGGNQEVCGIPKIYVHAHTMCISPSPVPGYEASALAASLLS